MLGEGLIEVPGISASLLSAIDSSMLLPSTETATARQPLVFYDSTGYYSAARHGNSNDATAANTSDAPWQYDFAILVLYAGLSASEHDQGQEAGGNGLTDGCEQNVCNQADINDPSSFQQLSSCVRTCAQARLSLENKALDLVLARQLSTLLVACAREKASGGNGSSLLASSVCSVR